MAQQWPNMFQYSSHYFPMICVKVFHGKVGKVPANKSKRIQNQWQLKQNTFANKSLAKGSLVTLSHQDENPHT